MSMGKGTGSGYPGWANCGLGSTVTTEDAKEIAPGMRMISTTSLTLAALDATKATVDMVVRNRIEGGPVAFPPTEILQELEIPTEAPPPETAYESGSEANADGSWGMWEVTQAPLSAATVQESRETIEVAGQRIACTRLEQSLEVGGQRLTMTRWLSDLIPGGLARSETSVDGNPAQASVTVVVSFLKK